MSTEIKTIEFYPKQRKVRVLDVVLDQLPLPEDRMAARFIPKWETLQREVCWDRPTLMLIRDLAVGLSGAVSKRLEGPTGVSKSFGLEVLASLTNRGYLRHNYSKDSDPGDTVGRFVPSDSKLAVQFNELLADPDLRDEARALVERAEAESRPLTLYESKKIAATLGLPDLNDGKNWRWKNGTLTGSMMYGSIFGADEPNLAPGNVLERENPALEKRPSLRLVEHQGEVVRKLSPEEQSIIDQGGYIPGVIGLDHRFWYVAAQNPYGIGGGRTEESEARRNRLQDRIVDPLTTEEYEQFLRFEISGDNPDIVWQHRRYIGEKDVQTKYRGLESIPNVDLVMKWLAQFQGDLEQLVQKGIIGSEKDFRGGSYVYARRNLERFLDTYIGAKNSLLNTTELFTKGILVQNTSPSDLFMEALRQEYLAGMYMDDQQTVMNLIQAAGIVDQLGASANNPSMPAWAKKAQQRGIDVAQGNGEWIITRTTTLGKVTVDEELELTIEALSEGYTPKESSDSIRLSRPLRSIVEVYEEQQSSSLEQKILTKKQPDKGD